MRQSTMGQDTMFHPGVLERDQAPHNIRKPCGKADELGHTHMRPIGLSGGGGGRAIRCTIEDRE